MTGEHWQALEAAFQRALELDENERDAFVARFAEEHPDLAPKLRDLLAADAGDDAGLRSPIAATAESLSTSAKDPWIGRTVGAWTITERLAGGGMGAVFLAERADDTYSQTAALKVMAAQLVATHAISRFRAERQILANLNHPYIAKLIDGGETEDGVPYLVMEYVQGLPIDAHCDTHALDIDARLALFRKVCDAVDYAHRNLVVHRDLKPSNILVDANGDPKLLDFGIAKLLEADAYNQTIAMTREGSRAMTPEYASPEQVRGEAVTVATDVYALGVLLFRLMTGQSPYGATTASSADYVRAIIEVDPRRPSTVVTAPETELEPAPRLAMSADRLRRSLKGDLDNIVLKALQKEPARRYPTAAVFAADIGRYLAHEPVEARGDDAWYRARKFVVRNARGLAITALVFVTVAGLVTYYTTQLAAERDRANLAAAESQEVADFLKNLFEQASPHFAKGEPVTAIELLEEGLERIDTLEGQPKLQAQLMQIMATSSMALGEQATAIGMLERALAMREAEVPPDPFGISLITHSLAEAHRQLTHYKEAEHYQRRTLDIAIDEFGADHDNVGYLKARLGVILFDDQRTEEALTLEQEGLDIMIANGSGESSMAIDTRGNIANALSKLGRFDEAASLLRETIALSEKVDGALHPNTAIRIGNLGLVLQNQGKLADALAAFEDSIERGRRIWSEDYDQIAFTIGSKASALRELGRMDEALAANREALGMIERDLGRDNLKYVRRLRALASVLIDMRRFDEASAYLDDALPVAIRLSGEDSSHTAQVYLLRGRMANDRGRYGEAQGWLERAKAAGPELGAWRQVVVDRELGRALSEQGQTADAEARLFAALARLEDSVPAGSATLLPTLAALAAHYRRAGDLDASLSYAERIRDIAAADPEPLTWSGALALGEAGRTFEGTGRDEAHAAYRTAHTELERVFGPDDPRVQALAPKVE